MKIVSSNLTVQLKSCQEKLCKISSLLPIFFDTKRVLEEAIPLIQACVRAQKQRSFNKATGSNEYIFSASNSISLTWDAAVDCLHDAEMLDNNSFSPLNVQQLALFPSIKDKCHWNGLCCIPDYVICQEYDLDKDMKDTVSQVIQQLEQHFPVVCVKNSQRYVLIDYTEMVFSPGLVHQVMVLDKKDDTEQTSEEEPGIAESDQSIMFYKQTGPIPLQKKFPQLLTVMLDYIKLHGFAAHVRRRSGTSSTCGVRLEDIRQHVLKNVEGLTKISKSKIHYLLKPANESTRDAARHKDCLDVRVGVKSCDISKDNVNAHEYFATVSVVYQMCAEYPDEAVIFSCDSKAKVHIGGQAVSRYHQIRTFFPSDDVPHYHDHDFPVPGYLIEPDGFLMLKSHRDKKIIKDSLDRDVIQTPATGPLWVYNRCVKNTSTTIVDHLSDLNNILETNPEINRAVLALLCDGGPDWSPKSTLTQFYLGRFWRDHNYDMLICVCHAPGLSRYNPIEHLWSPCSKWLAGVSLSACLPGEDTPPSQQSLTSEELHEKEKLVFSNALDALDSYWNGKVHDGFRITSKGITEPHFDQYTDFHTVKDTLKGSLKSIRESEEKTKLLEEWKYFVKHMDRRRGFVCFRKGICDDHMCDCRKNEVQAVNIMKLPMSRRWAFPPITPDPQHLDHYMTFRQLTTALKFSNPDEHLKEIMNSRCDKCRYVFTSENDKDKHLRLIHGGVRSRGESASDNLSGAAKKSKTGAKCPVCGEMFSSRYQMQKHQTEKNHKLGRGRPKKN